MKILDRQIEILFIDSDPGRLSVGSLMLLSMGNFIVHPYHLFEDACARVGEHQPDVLLLDLQPNLLGLQHLNTLRGLTAIKNIPVIFLIDQDQRAHLKTLTIAHLIGLISKPCEVINLAEQVWQIWGDRMAQLRYEKKRQVGQMR